MSSRTILTSSHPLAAGFSQQLRRNADHDFARPPFLNSVTTRTADIDYQTIITYTGGYDDMVLQKTQIRSRWSNRMRSDKKIAQLNEFMRGSRRARARAR
jgi:ATPase subunit of ABC transporter with duplicated ATPase domains